MTNKLVISRYGNDQYRFFGVNVPLVENARYFDKYMLETDPEKVENTEPRALSIFEAVQKINLVEDVTINKYEVTVGIARAFEDDIDEWNRIIHDVAIIVTEAAFGYGALFEQTERDLSEQYKRQSRDDAY